MNNNNKENNKNNKNNRNNNNRNNNNNKIPFNINYKWRRCQLNIIRESVGYKNLKEDLTEEKINFLVKIPKEDLNVSKRSFQGLLRICKIRVHEFDEYELSNIDNIYFLKTKARTINLNNLTGSILMKI